jgi:phenylalanyl-tRNA synthetase beta subunit
MLYNMPKNLHTKPFSFEKVEKPFWADNVAWLNIVHENKVVGSMGVLSKKVALAAHIKNSAVALFEFNIDSLQLHPSRTNVFYPVPEYPMTD